MKNSQCRLLRKKNIFPKNISVKKPNSLKPLPGSLRREKPAKIERKDKIERKLVQLASKTVFHFTEIVVCDKPFKLFQSDGNRM